jgi:hypothetical protein
MALALMGMERPDLGRPIWQHENGTHAITRKGQMKKTKILL